MINKSLSPDTIAALNCQRTFDSATYSSDDNDTRHSSIEFIDDTR